MSDRRFRALRARLALLPALLLASGCGFASLEVYGVAVGSGPQPVVVAGAQTIREGCGPRNSSGSYLVGWTIGGEPPSRAPWAFQVATHSRVVPKRIVAPRGAPTLVVWHEQPEEGYTWQWHGDEDQFRTLDGSVTPHFSQEVAVVALGAGYAFLLPDAVVAVTVAGKERFRRPLPVAPEQCEGNLAGRTSIAAAWDGSAVAASVSCADGVHIMGLRVDGTELWPPRTIAPSHALTPRPTYLAVDAPVLVVREDGAAVVQRRCTIDARGAQADLPAGISVLAGSKGRWLITSQNGEVAVADDQGVAVTRTFKPPFETSFAGDERGFIAAGYDSGRDCIGVTRIGLDGTPTALACFDLRAEVPQAPCTGA